MSGGFAILAVAIATAGYILASKCLLNRYRVARQSGHRLYLSSLKYGVYALFPALLITWILSLATSILNTPITTAALTILSSIIFTEYYNRKPGPSQWKELKELIKNIRNHSPAENYEKFFNIFEINKERKTVALWEAWQENDVELICAYAVGEFKPIAVTLDSKKVYVGMVSDTIEPSDQESYLSILPLYSGYRDDSQAFKLNHKYTTLINALLDDKKNLNGNVLDYAIAIPVERIVTIHIFNENLYREVSGHSPDSLGHQL